MTAPLPRRIDWFAPKRLWWVGVGMGLIGIYVAISAVIAGRCEVCGKRATLVITFTDFDSKSVTHRYCEAHRHMAPER